MPQEIPVKYQNQFPAHAPTLWGYLIVAKMMISVSYGDDVHKVGISRSEFSGFTQKGAVEFDSPY
ncbi:hypothetical protein D3C73_1245550 [compost metagenome]